MTGPDLLDAVERLLAAASEWHHPSETQLGVMGDMAPIENRLDDAVDAIPPDAIPRLRALLRTDESKTWRCFYCDEVFTTETEAAQHFGGREGLPGWDVAACVDPLRSDEKARMAELHEARVHALRKQHEAEDREELARELDDVRSEIGRLFGKCAGVTASTPHEAYLVMDYERGRVAALEELLAEAQQNARTDKETAALRAAAVWYDRLDAASCDAALEAIGAIPAARREQIMKEGQGG